MDGLNLTVGFELEFQCVFDPTFVAEQFFACGLAAETDRIGARRMIHVHLELASIPVTGAELELAEYDPYTKWTVGSDDCWLSNAEQDALPQGYIAQTVELKSPKFKLTEDWPEKLRDVLDVMRIVEHHMQCRFVLNHTTGFHVHVGNGERSIPFDTCKRLFQLVTAHERNLDAVHSVDRILGHEAYSSATPVINPPSYFLNMLDPEPSPSIFSRLRMIERTNSFRELGSLFETPWRSAVLLDGHSSAYNFDNNFALYAEHSRVDLHLLKTVEFRQHNGTLDFMEIVNWIDVVTQLVRCAHTMAPIAFLKLLAAGTDVRFGLSDLLTAIGCTANVVKYFRRDGSAPMTGFVLQRDASGNVKGDSPQLRLLDAINDHEQSMRADPKAVQDVIWKKWYGGVYGLSPYISPAVVSDADIEHAMVQTRAKLVWPVREVSSQIRDTLFAALHLKYLSLEGSMPPPLKMAMM